MYSDILEDVLSRKPASGCDVYIRIFTLGGKEIEVNAKHITCNQRYFEIKTHRRNIFMIYSNIDYIEVFERSI